MMRAHVVSLIGLFSLLAADIAVTADEAAPREACASMVDLLPDPLRDLPVVSCAVSNHAQILITLDMDVPAHRVRTTHDILQRTTGMGPLRFACCGYEARPVTLPLPADHPLRAGLRDGVFRDVSLTLYAPAFAGDESGQGPLDLGELNATLTLELVDY